MAGVANTVANTANTLKGVVRQCSPNTAEQCSPMYAVRQNVRLAATPALPDLSSTASVLIDRKFAGAISKSRIGCKNATYVAPESLKSRLIRRLVSDGARAQVSTSAGKLALR